MRSRCAGRARPRCSSSRTPSDQAQVRSAAPPQAFQHNRRMFESSLPLVLIEGVLILGGALLFGWWQLRSVKRDQALWAERERAQALAKQAAEVQAASPAALSADAPLNNPVGAQPEDPKNAPTDPPAPRSP